MKSKKPSAVSRAFAFLRRSGVLLVSDPKLPSTAGLVAQAPLRGSWWAHPQSHEIFRVVRRLAGHPDILTARLISGKLTFIHRKLWPVLFAAVDARECREGLSPLASRLLTLVSKAEVLRTDELARDTRQSAKALGRAARELERRLLVYGEQLHTGRGAHTKQLETWEHLARRLKVKLARVARPSARKKLEALTAELSERTRTRVTLPWTRGG